MIKHFKEYLMESLKVDKNKILKYLQSSDSINYKIKKQGNQEIIYAEKKLGGTNFLTIIPAISGFSINVTSGNIENPSKELGATWYNLGDKDWDAEGVIQKLKNYGII